MRSVILSASLLCLIVEAQGPGTGRIPFQVVSKSSIRAATGTCSDSSCGQLGDINDSVYVSTITVGGVEFNVLLDTGSSDLWVNASLHPIPNAQILQSVVVSEVYGDQSNYTGPVAFAPVEFHGFKVANQSYTNAIVSENDNTANLNVTGLIGLSFDGLSEVQQKVEEATGSATAGQTFLSNVFAADPTQPNFISFWLSREADLNTTANTGAFTISQVEKGFEAISNQPAVNLISKDAIEWSVPLDSMTVGGSTVDLPSSVVSSSTVPGKSVVLLDTGTSNILAPDAIVSKIYGSMDGAKEFAADRSGTTSLWALPCDVEPPAVTFVIGGTTIPIHPLDLSTVSGVYQTNTGQDVSLCLGGFISSQPLRNRFDILLGSPFLRNTYTTFNFGSNSSAPTGGASSTSGSSFVRILPITDPKSASSDFASTRAAQLKNAPGATPAQVQQILSGAFPQVNTPPVGGGGGGGGGSGGGGSGGGGSPHSGTISTSVSVEKLVVAAFVAIAATFMW